MKLELLVAGKPVVVELERAANGWECRLDGALVQSSRTSEMVFSVPELVA